MGYFNFGGYCKVDELARLQTAVQVRVNELIDDGQQPVADRLLDAYVKFINGLDALAVQTAARGTEILRLHEEESVVRGGRPEGDLKLRHALFCRPTKLFGLHGAVGIADYDTLDAEVPWWWTQEFGSDHNVGRIIFGAFFHPGPETRPKGDLDKEHAFFEPRASSDHGRHEAGEQRLPGREEGKRGSMEVRKAIAAKHFLEAGARQIEGGWKLKAEALQAEFINEVSRLI